jgi:hypothetical protein
MVAPKDVWKTLYYDMGKEIIKIKNHATVTLW